MSNEQENCKTLKKLIEKYPQVKIFKNPANDLILQIDKEKFRDLNLLMDPPIFLRLVKDFVRLMGLLNLS